MWCSGSTSPEPPLRDTAPRVDIQSELTMSLSPGVRTPGRVWTCRNCCWSGQATKYHKHKGLGDRTEGEVERTVVAGLGVGKNDMDH